MPFLNELVDHAIAYYRDFVRPEKRYRHPSDVERAALADLAETLKNPDRGADAEAIQKPACQQRRRGICNRKCRYQQPEAGLIDMQIADNQRRQKN